MCFRVDISENEAQKVAKFITGLGPELKRELLVQRLPTLNDAISGAAIIEMQIKKDSRMTRFTTIIGLIKETPV